MNKHITKRYNRVFKKTTSSRGWLFEKVINHKRYQFPLGKCLSIAKDLADEIDAHIFMESIESAVRRYKKGIYSDTKKVPLIREIVERYRKKAPTDIGVQKSTIDAYCNALLSIMDEDRPLSDLTSEVISEYKAMRLRGVEDQQEIKSRKRSINSVLTNAKSVFGKDTVDLYKDWDMRGTKALHEALPYKRVKKAYRLPQSSLVKSTFDLCEFYYENGRVDSYLALSMALYFGLRRNEIFNSRRSWISIPNDGLARIGVFSERSFNVKSSEDGYAFGSAVTARKLLDTSEGFDYLISERNIRKCFDLVITDLRNIGWGDMRKPLHECRKLYGSYLSTTQSIYYAQKSLRHATPMTTNDFYADLMTDDSIVALWSA